MFRVIVLSITAAILAGCGQGGPCKARSGSYRVNLNYRTGNCGGSSEIIVDADSQLNSPSACSGTRSETPDHCEADEDLLCPNGQGVNGPATVRTTGTLHWSSDGRSGSGMLTFYMTDGSGGACQGSYDATYTKL